MILSSEVCFPIQSNTNKSDHNLITYECLLNRPATFAWETHEYVKVTKKGTEKFNQLIKNESWDAVKALAPDPDKMVEKFQSILDGYVSSCFSWKRIRRKSNDSPWLTDGLRALIKKRLSIFRAEGRSLRWKRLDVSIKKTIETRKGSFFDKESERLRRTGRQSSWYNILSKITDDDALTLWSIADLEPEKSAETLAEELALHFTSITNIASPLLPTDVPKAKADVPSVLVPQLLVENVEKMIRDYKKPNSSVKGDIPKALVSPLAGELAIPLTSIYNICLADTKWPEQWKRETVIPIPKKQTPNNYNDLRPISMSPLWSKILESVMADVTLRETKQNWKQNQHGGIKGLSTDHVLIESWDRILRALDKSSSNKAVVFTALDFSKSFSRCSHQEILLAYKDVGASNWLLKMQAAFLSGRSMQVKLGLHLSEPLPVTGRAIQGSVLGILDHNVVLNNLDDDLLDIYVAKYINDMTLVDVADNEVPTDIDTSGNRALHTIYPGRSQEAFGKIAAKAEDKGLKINDDKTQLLSVSSSFYDTRAIIKDRQNKEIHSSD